MKGKQSPPTTIDEYIAGFPTAVQDILQKIRTTIAKAVPGAHEAIKYQIPTFVLTKNLVHFAAYKSHIGVYPAPHALPKTLAKYQTGKGTLQFPLDEPIPYERIAKVVTLLVKEQSAKK
jgi:uncharacterized protein YdhG (YjbR/CyaY superfamily)